MYYTIFVSGPFSPTLDRSKLIQNAAGQLIAFDGKAIWKDIHDAAERLAPHCASVAVYRGKQLGKQVMHWCGGKETKAIWRPQAD